MTEEPAVPFNPRRSDDPFHRIQTLAEKRARSNGLTEDEAHKAGRAAMALRKLLVAAGELEPNAETILRTVAGEFRRA